MKKVLFLMVSVLILGLVFTGCGDIVKFSSPATVNTDSDLYKCECSSDSATGVGERIKEKGKWFMYNYYDGDPHCFYIQVGNPKGGDNWLGWFCIWPAEEEHHYVATYEWNEMTSGPDLVVLDEHLAISDTMNFTASPGTDDNADWGVPFYDEDGEFYVFAHFSLDCAE